MNHAAQQLGRLARGKPKRLTKAERRRRAARLEEARAKRWPSKHNAPAHLPPASGGKVPPVVLQSESKWG